MNTMCKRAKFGEPNLGNNLRTKRLMPSPPNKFEGFDVPMLNKQVKKTIPKDRFMTAADELRKESAKEMNPRCIAAPQLVEYMSHTPYRS
jgi:hypothetical protein